MDEFNGILVRFNKKAEFEFLFVGALLFDWAVPISRATSLSLYSLFAIPSFLTGNILSLSLSPLFVSPFFFFVHVFSYNLRTRTAIFPCTYKYSLLFRFGEAGTKLYGNVKSDPKQIWNINIMYKKRSSLFATCVFITLHCMSCCKCWSCFVGENHCLLC